MLKRYRLILIRFLLLWLITGIVVSTLMYIVSRLEYYFRWGKNWSQNRYFEWTYFLGMTIPFFFVAVIAYFLYNSLARVNYAISLSKQKFKVFFVWSMLFGLAMAVFVMFTTIGTTSTFDLFKIMAFTAPIGALIPAVDCIVQRFLISS